MRFPHARDLRSPHGKAWWCLVNLDVLRSYFLVAELGSLSKASERLHVSQSTLTRQMQGLENEIGGRLLERGHGGVALTAAGITLLEGMRPVVANADEVVARSRRRARGQSTSIRIGYITSAAEIYLNPALAALRRSRPQTKVHLVDLSPGEQLEALRRGDLDVVVLGNINAAIAREFFVRRIATFSVVAALPEIHPLAAGAEVDLVALRREMFVGAAPEAIPGFNPWISKLCRRAGFRPKFVEVAGNLAQAMALLVSEDAVTLLPGLVRRIEVPGVVFRPLRAPAAEWHLQVAWHRGRITEPVRELVNLLTTTRAQSDQMSTCR